MKVPFCSRLRSVATRLGLGAVLLVLANQSVEAKPAKLLDIADSVNANKILTKFALIVQASDLGTFLSSRGPFTLFAPTDAAFDKLPPGTLAALLQPQNKERLQDILLYHLVANRRLTSKDLVPLTSVLSCEGNPTNALTLKTTKSGAQYVFKAKIVHADIRCQNGIINEIDTVLMPPESSLPPLAPPPPPAPPTPATNAPAASMPNDLPPQTPAAPAPGTETNNAPVIPVAPISTPETPEVSPH